jgi:MSHA biogenesis protein MshL
MQGYKKIYRLLLIIALLLNTSCYVHSKHGNSIDQMHDILQEGIKDNTPHNTKKRFHPLPASVSRALLTSDALGSRSRCIPQKRFDISANQMPAKVFFMSLVEGTPYNMVVDPAVSGTISLQLKKVTIREALEAVRDTYGFEFHKHSYGYEVVSPKIETMIFTINYLDVKRKGKSLTEMTSGQISEQVGTTTSGGTSSMPAVSTGGSQTITSGSTVDTRSETDFWRTIESSLKTMVGNQNGRSVIVNSQSGVIIVHAFPLELHQVTRFLERIQTNLKRQVILEAKILEVQLNDQFQSGIDWNVIGQVITKEEGGIAQSAFHKFDNSNLNDFKSMFTLRINGDFGGLIKLLQTQGNVQVLSSPRISTMNNQKAVIKVGNDQFFVTGVSTTNVTSALATNVFPTQNINLTPFFSGVTLDVTPQISRTGEVILHIHPTVSLVRDQEKTIVLGNNGLPNSQNTYILPLAQSAIRESDNIVRAKSGQVIVIGGLMQNDMREEVAGTPVLSKVPFFGFLFRRTQQLSSKIELIILLRPLLSTDKNWRTEMRKADKIFDNMHRGFHLGGLPEVFGDEGEQPSENEGECVA